MRNMIIAIVVAVLMVGVGVAGIASGLMTSTKSEKKIEQAGVAKPEPKKETGPAVTNVGPTRTQPTMSPAKTVEQPSMPAVPKSPAMEPDIGDRSMMSMSRSEAVAKEDKSDEEFDGNRIRRTAAEWRRLLTPDQFYILRESGTEQPYSGEYTDNKQTGVYACAACGLHLFHSKAKFDSGTGWPSFFEPIKRNNVDEKEDRSLEEVRTEVRCRRCGGHLGHVFDDGPEPTGLRYCINSAALTFKPSR